MYHITDIELARPLAPVPLAAGVDGVAVVARLHGRAIGFFMLERTGPGELGVAELAGEVADRLWWKIVQERLRAELRTAPEARPPEPSVSVAVCTKDRPDVLDRCLRSIARATSAPGRHPPVEVLVVDNAPSTDATRRVVAGHAGVRYLVEPKPGLDFARNLALRAARGDLVAYVDDDATVDPAWLDGLYAAWAENPDAACFTGLILPYELATEAQVLCERRGGFRKGFEKVRYGRSCPVYAYYPCCAGVFGVGANMAFRRDVLLTLGGFDEALDTGAPLPGGGDHDAFYRVVRAGHALVYEPGYLAYHEHRRELAKLRRMYWTWGLGFLASAVKSYRTDPPMRPRIRGLLRWWFLNEAKQLLKSLLGRHVLAPGYIVAELGGGIVGLFGEYSRSQRRVRRIHQQHADDARAV